MMRWSNKRNLTDLGDEEGVKNRLTDVCIVSREMVQGEGARVCGWAGEEGSSGQSLSR